MALCLIHKCDPIWGFYFINIRPYDLVERLSFAKLYSSVYNGNVWTVHKFVIDRCMCRDSHNLTALSLTCPLYTLDSHWPVINLLTGGNVLLFVCVHLNNDFFDTPCNVSLCDGKDFNGGFAVRNDCYGKLTIVLLTCMSIRTNGF